MELTDSQRKKIERIAREATVATLREVLPKMLQDLDLYGAIQEPKVSGSPSEVKVRVEMDDKSGELTATIRP
jgi:hypothetical protein